MAKTKDLFLNMVANPNMTLEDLASVGLTSENTMLLDRASYASNEKVQQIFQDTNGNFDEAKFNTWYDMAEYNYNILATDEANLKLMDVTAYDVDNVFVDPSKRTRNNAPVIVKLPNPDRLNVGLTRVGKIGPRTLSQDEIAQTQEVLLNPTEVAKGAKPIYGKSPNDSWFDDFWDTKVMAAWDEDGVHIDPVTGMEMQHKKGDLKLNENGTYYYESLDGRSVYGKRILNKFNTLTTDGSAWNKYDFFDSDDIEQKSVGGSIMKNLALVGSMFIPYVGWGIAGASVVHQMAGLTATFGKMLAGSDSPTLNALEGWVKSTDRRNLKTEYAQQNMWCWENFIDLIGDTTAQLREQRAIFKFAPGIIKGDFKALSDKKMAKYADDIARESMENATNKSFRDIARLAYKQNPVHHKEQLSNLMTGARDIFTVKAQKAARDYVTNYYKLGEPIARAYMTAITVQDTFGEAIQAGATDTEATLLTLGYAAAEAALLSTDLGKWIMPELRMERQRARTIAKKLMELPPETRELSRQLTRLDGETKKNWAKRLFNVGKDIFTAEYSMAKKSVGSVLAQGLGEGFEEVSEEALADFSKSCFNVVQKLQGDEVRLNAWNHNWSWSEAANRYGMSFAGGILGGSINAAASDFKGYRDLDNMTSQQAMQEFIYMVRNGKMDDFWKDIDKTEIASKELSTQMNESGIGYKPGTKTDNQDLEAKRVLKKLETTISSILDAENAKLDDSGLLATLIKADPSLRDLEPVKEYRMRALANSATAGRLLNEYNTVLTDISKQHLAKMQIIEKYGDVSSEKYSDEDKKALKEIDKVLKTLQDRKNGILDGERTREYVRDALFEMSYAIKDPWDTWATEVRYAEAITGKAYKDIPEERKKELKEQYERAKSSNEYAEQVHELANMYEALAISTSESIQASAEYYENLRKTQFEDISKLHNVVSKRLSLLEQFTEDKDNGVEQIQAFLNAISNDLVHFEGSETLQQGIASEWEKIQESQNQILQGRNKEELSFEEKKALDIAYEVGQFEISKLISNAVFAKIDKTIDEAVALGYIHPETKHMLNQLSNALQHHLGKFQYEDGMPLHILEKQEEMSLEELDSYDDKYMALSEKLQILDNLPSTPIVDNLKKFHLSTTFDQSVLDLVIDMITQEGKFASQIDTFQLDTDTLNLFEEARHFLELYRSAIVGARYDNIDIDHIVGFNTTLNELSGTNEKPNLAEIDAQTADLILEDVNMVLKRINFAEGLHTLNTGNKYNVQDKTGLNKQYILYNKIKHFISVLGDDDEWKDKGEDTTRADLEAAIAKATLLSKYGHETYSERTFSISKEEKAEIEKQSIDIQRALHKFLQAHIDHSETSVQKLKKILKYDNFKGLIRQNDGFLNQDSQDIDDSAFIWWLCATAALDPDQFYNTYRQVIGSEEEGEKPIAPLPTQELGVYALTASIVDGNMFQTFGKALRASLLDTWANGTPEIRDQIRNAYEGNLLDDTKKDIFKNIDFLPNFDSILFIEGIAGSGKSTGVLRTWSKLMAKANPDWIQKKVVFAHTSKEKAGNLAQSTAFANYDVHDHDSLLSWMSSNYKNIQDKDGVSTYIMGKDIQLIDGIFRSKWELRKLDQSEIPSVIVIDEWTHYDQLEQELIQRFAQTYGVAIVAMGDYDQLTAVAKVKQKETDSRAWVELSPHRNMTARTAKLGVSMRTDNEIKNNNMYSMLAWKLNPTNMAIDLHYYEDDSGIYGDKVYNVGEQYGSELDKIKEDVIKMVNTLKEGESIGYVYYDSDSELYKWLTTTEGIKEHITAYTEQDAHGRESQYYIIESNRDTSQDAEVYFNALNTGITRSEQGSIVIVPNQRVQDKGAKDKYNKVGILFKGTRDSEVLPNTYTDAGTREFSKRRKAIFDDIYQDTEVTPFEIKPRTKERITITRTPHQDESPEIVVPKPEDPTTNDPTTPSDSSDTTQTTPQEPTSQTDSEEETSAEELPSPDNVPTEVYERMDLSQIPTARTEEEEQAMNQGWQGPLPKDQILYSPKGKGEWKIIGEKLTNSGPGYIIEHIENGDTRTVLKEQVHSSAYLTLPEEGRLFDVNQPLLHKTRGKVIVQDIHLEGDQSNPHWVYVIGDQILSHEEASAQWQDKTLSTYVDPVIVENVEREPTAYEVEGEQTWMALANEQFSDPLPQITSNGTDINFELLGFTFNTFYLADEFDGDGKLITSDTTTPRIDNGYGLYGLNSQKFNNRTTIESTLGVLRRHLEFLSNGEISNYLNSELGLQNATVRWAFVSKAVSGDRTDKYGRFNSARAQLQNMHKEDLNIPPKTISAIIYNSKGIPVLEVPMVTLQSPHSIFYAMSLSGIGKDITSLWTFRDKKPKQTYDEIINICHYIDTHHANDSGYQRLADVLKLWLFTGNGVKIIPNPSDSTKAWNLHEFTKNKGNFYVTERYAESNHKYDFTGEWVDLETAANRSDRFISNIFMNNSDRYEVPGSETLVNVFRKYTPYVLISDHPSITNDAEAMEQYLKQQADETLEVIVKAVPVIPPEISVSEYIKGMNQILHAKSGNFSFGNHYTPVRIWEAILRSPKAAYIMDALSSETRQFVINTINQLSAIKQSNPQAANESNLKYKARIAGLQNNILRESYYGEGENHAPVYQKLRKALVDTCFHVRFGSDERGNLEVLQAIQEACDATISSENPLTGVLGHTLFDKEHAYPVKGVGYRVKVDGKYKFPGGGAFRIFGKIDSPTYDLGNLANNISQWVRDADYGKPIIDPTTQRQIGTAEVWYFNNDDAAKYYLPQKKSRKLNLRDVIQKGKDLLVKLGIQDYNIDTTELNKCNTEAEALNLLTNQIIDRYLEDLGTFIIWGPNGECKYGNIISEQTPEFANLKFIRSYRHNGKYVLEFKNLVTDTVEKHEIEIDQASDSFLITPAIAINQTPTVDVVKMRQLVEEEISLCEAVMGIIPGIESKISLYKEIQQCYDESTNTINVPQIYEIMSQYGLDDISKDSIVRTLRLSELDQSQNEDMCINPIKIKFK